MKVMFSVNSYDYEGDIVDRAIFLHVGDITIIQFKDVDELKQFAETILNNTIPEIRENWRAE